MTDYQSINYLLEDSIAVITINNPPANSLSMKVMSEIDDAIRQAAADDNVRAVIITGIGGSFFAAGADIKEIVMIDSKDKGQEVSLKGQEILSGIEGLNKVVIAAINGLCLGGGNELAMACHIRIASETTKFGQPEINLGIIPGFGGTQRLPRIVGKGKALEMILTGDMITAKEALRIGLVDKIVPANEVLKHAKGLAKRITSKGMKAIKTTLDIVNKGLKETLDKGLGIEADAFGKICETEDMKEGLMAFIEKRQAIFKDK